MFIFSLDRPVGEMYSPSVSSPRPSRPSLSAVASDFSERVLSMRQIKEYVMHPMIKDRIDRHQHLTAVLANKICMREDNGGSMEWREELRHPAFMAQFWNDKYEGEMRWRYGDNVAVWSFVQPWHLNEGPTHHIKGGSRDLEQIVSVTVGWVDEFAVRMTSVAQELRRAVDGERFERRRLRQALDWKWSAADHKLNILGGNQTALQNQVEGLSASLQAQTRSDLETFRSTFGSELKTAADQQLEAFRAEMEVALNCEIDGVGQRIAACDQKLSSSTSQDDAEKCEMRLQIDKLTRQVQSLAEANVELSLRLDALEQRR